MPLWMTENYTAMLHDTENSDFKLNIHCSSRSIPSPIQIIEFLCFNHYKIKHIDMQTAFTNICERMGPSQQLGEFLCGTVIGCHLCNKSSCEIFSLLNIPQSTVHVIITKWKQLEKTLTQPQSGRPQKNT